MQALARRHTLHSLGLLSFAQPNPAPKSLPKSEPSVSARIQSPFISPLTESPSRYATTMILFPFQRAVFDVLSSNALTVDRAAFEEARIALYEHAYEAVSSLILAILNIDSVRKIREATTIIEQGLWAEASQKRRISETLSRADMPLLPANSELGRLAKEAGEIRDRTVILINDLAQNPDYLGLCEQIVEMAAKFRAILANLYSSHVDRRRLYGLIPDYGFDMQRFIARDFDDLMQLLYGARSGPPVNFGDQQLSGHLADVYIRLEPHCRSSQTFSQLLPVGLPYAIDPIGIIIRGDNDGRLTRFATLFKAIEANLKSRFDSQEVTGDNGQRSLIFFPKLTVVPRSISELFASS